MWLRIVCLAFGALLLDPVVSEDITCETIEISKGTHNFTATIHSSSFEGQNNDRFYSCVWLRSQTSDFAPELQWTGRFRLVFAGYRAECASVSVRISYMENGAFQSTDVRPTTTGIGNGRMSHKFSKKISLDSNSRITVYTNPGGALTCLEQLEFNGYENAASRREIQRDFTIQNTKTTTKTTTTRTTTTTQKPTTQYTTRTTTRPPTTRTTTTTTTRRPTSHYTVITTTTQKPNVHLPQKTPLFPLTDTTPTPPTAPTRTTTTTGWTPPDWPPSTNDITLEPTTTTISTSLTPTSSTPNSVDIIPTPPAIAVNNDRYQWRIISFVFIGLAGLLLIVTVLLYMSMLKRKPIEETVFSIPRPNIVTKA